MLETVWQFIVEKITGLMPVISPFWFEWLPLGALIIFGCLVVGWFFPPVRSLAGAVVMSTVTFLVAFRKGESASDARNKKLIEKLRHQKQQQQNNNPWEWWR